MSDPTAAFFDDLGRSGHSHALEKATGTLRFDVAHGGRTEPWFVTIDRGDVAVSHSTRRADCVASGDKAVFDGLVSGRQNALAALLRGDVGVQGDIELLVLFQRLFPSTEVPA